MQRSLCCPSSSVVSSGRTGPRAGVMPALSHPSFTFPECGAAFTSKLEGMFKDMELSKDIMVHFKQHMQNQRAPGPIDLTVNHSHHGLLAHLHTHGIAPPSRDGQTSGSIQDVLPRQAQWWKLQWQTALGRAVLKADFKEAKKEFQRSLFQTLVLLMFNGGRGVWIQL
jgi:cullin-4